jgi:putative redox protein
VKITLLSDERLRLEPTPGPMTIEAASPERAYSPFHMVGSGLATCVLSVLASWAETAGFTADDLVIEVEWTFAEKPHRIGRFALALHWPSLPEPRRGAATRVAALCPIHATLHTPPEIEVAVRA